MIVIVKSSVNGAREERMTIMDIAACVKWTLNVTAGKAQLLQHAKRKKHTEVIKHMQSVKQSKLLFSHSQASSSSQGGPSSSQRGPGSS